ncbi:m7GpppX diphosphatase-like [Glossina fuscipes]|uniref:m7GpppX diphosphatase n=1 Tax=Glossina fuscipes TaxID=7396 RepID=A0A9C5ZFH7_9MUSC|nr:m7GpppX diphosphatase-like [Glossina fuscipes]
MPETFITSKMKTKAGVVEADKEADLEKKEVATLTKPTSVVKYNLTNFRLQRILNNNTRNKSIALLGCFPEQSDADKAVVIFEKQAFRESEVATESDQSGKQLLEKNCENNVKDTSLMSYFCSDLKVQTEFINDIYGSYQCVPPVELSGVKTTVIYPASQKHIEKYTVCQKYIISESPELYEEITLPYISTSQHSLEWVYNILDHKQEVERIVYEDPDPETGFILLPDLKWDGRTLETLYLLAISHKRDIKSMRDLNAQHLPLLRNIRLRAAEVIEKRYGLLSAQLRMYLHYQPSFYHLHVHINPIRHDAPGIWCEKSHMLDTVMNNLELIENYYQKATLPFVLHEGNELLEKYELKMLIRRAPKHLSEKYNEKDETSSSKKLKLDDVTISEVVSK